MENVLLLEERKAKQSKGKEGKGCWMGWDGIGKGKGKSHRRKELGSDV